MSTPPSRMKCPQCNNEGAHVYLENYIYWIDCGWCGLKNLLRNVQHLIKQKQNEKTT